MSTQIVYRDVGLPFPWKMLQIELDDQTFGGMILKELKDIMGYYSVYEDGADFISETGAKIDYKPSDMPYQYVKSIIDKQARFMFSKQPDFNVKLATEVQDDSEGEKRDDEVISQYQELLDTVLSKNRIGKLLLAGLKDCFIGKRVAAILNFSPEDGITIQFIPSYGFVHNVDPITGDMTKISVLFNLVMHEQREAQRIYKKTYEMFDDGFCYVSEGIYNGLGELVEEIISEQATLFTYIPAYVFVNDGLTGDVDGVSEVKHLMMGERWYSKLANADMDAERFGMNPIRYAVDMNPATTKKENLSIAAGAFWDLSTDTNLGEAKQGKVGVLEQSMGYSNSLGVTLDRIKGMMYDLVDLPDIRTLEARVASGKTLKALYWPLIVRSDEKMQEWQPGLEFLAMAIIEGANLYPEIARLHDSEFTPSDLELEVFVENQYPLPEDEELEKTLDMAEIQRETRSRKSYLKKWHRMTDEEADDELAQILREKNMMATGVTVALTDFKKKEMQSIEDKAAEQNPKPEGDPGEGTDGGAAE